MMGIKFYVVTNGMWIEWERDDGFYGQTYIRVKNGKVFIDGETMGKEFVKALLVLMVDSAIMDTDEVQE